MERDRSTLLAAERKVKSSDVRWYFIADIYDVPISGLATFRDQVYRFCSFPEDVRDRRIYFLQELTADELAEELRVKSKFEVMVGTHWSFDKDGEPLPRVLHDEESRSLFYAQQETPEFPSPWDRPVFAWFDLDD